jgi:type IV pilus assembly protein PilY1
MVYDPQIRNGKMIFTTLIPIDTATNPCLAGGTSWLTDVDALTGGPLAYPPFDVNGDRSFAVIPTNLYADYLKIGGTNYVPVSRKSQVGITPKPTVIGTQKQDKEFKVSSGSSGLLESVLENPGSISRKVVRRAWREVIRN